MWTGREMQYRASEAAVVPPLPLGPKIHVMPACFAPPHKSLCRPDLGPQPLNEVFGRSEFPWQTCDLSFRIFDLEGGR
eukprot:CAMPEP_0174297610 /NCGR_PEP_ID=MMETSP0809-20121228/51521_1 /TAXON_ID=73025 ORGANISM="Eutreptiella gymnastica-like, Strain CCMP1594" /NCGR_SAMPLE_ID=MMETSP0809 /ASSEMBLY_ACC=CAM_ASM_000658 /LENGTH=77 /DNA_ID=CAMNT_0015401515 /DNA_START=141 /DNA_END=371 /DNA_ORIENTATION=-